MTKKGKIKIVQAVDKELQDDNVIKPLQEGENFKYLEIWDEEIKVKVSRPNKESFVKVDWWNLVEVGNILGQYNF